MLQFRFRKVLQKLWKVNMIEMHEAQNERNFYSLPVDADVVPIQVSGTLDTEMTSLTTTECSSWHAAAL